MHAGEGKHYSFPFGTPRNMCLQHVFKWAAYRCFQSCCSPREGLRANQRRWYLVRETLLSYSACFSEKMQIDSFLLLRTTSDKGVPRQSSPFKCAWLSFPITIFSCTTRSASCRGWGGAVDCCTEDERGDA